MPPYRSSRSLPSAWETQATSARSQNALSYLEIDCLRVKYVGPGDDDRQAATTIANYPVPMDVPLFYFEVHILSKGVEGFIGMGFQTEDVSLARLPGWEPRSYGYHGDDGNSFASNGHGQPYGPGYTTGDTVGALLNRAERTITFYKNGTCLGVAFRNVMEERLHPAVGLRTKEEEVTANFGSQPFVADFDAIVAAFRDKVMSSIAATPLPLVSSRSTPLLPQLLHDYLVHNRCSQTAAIIHRDLLKPQGEAAGPADSPDQESSRGKSMAARQTVFDLVTAGKMKGAEQELVRRYGSGPLDSNPGLYFKLKIAQFCEVLSACGPDALEPALAFGRQVLAPHSPKGPAQEELLSDALSLLAYQQPESSPSGYLLAQASRNSLAEDLDAAILKHQGLPTVSPLERLFQQAALLMSELQGQGHPQALALDLRKVLFGQPAQSKGS